MTKPIYILCLHGVRTGGPEAIHQLSDALIEQGFDARMVYYDWDEIARLERAATDNGYQFAPRLNMIAEYDRYRIRPTHIAPNQGEIIVLPEPLCHLALKFDKSTVLIWWLSVDNGFGSLSKVNLNHLRKANVWHAAQSAYAAGFIRALQFQDAGPLSDYTVVSGEAFAPIHDRPLRVVFNATPHKVVDDIDGIMAKMKEAAPEIECVTIGRGALSRESLETLFASSRLYVDLGCFPGMDRMPREAGALGCQVLTKKAGAWAHSEWPHASENAEALVKQISVMVREPCRISWRAFEEREDFFAEAVLLFRDRLNVL